MLEFIFNDKYISASEMAEKVGISQRAVEKQLAKLKKIGVIERIGADKGGYWEIKQEGE